MLLSRLLMARKPSLVFGIHRRTTSGRPVPLNACRVAGDSLFASSFTATSNATPVPVAEIAAPMPCSALRSSRVLSAGRPSVDGLAICFLTPATSDLPAVYPMPSRSEGSNFMVALKSAESTIRVLRPWSVSIISWIIAAELAATTT